NFQFAMGGQVPIEAEGQELIETPQGQIGEIQGPSHEQGGVPMNVPKGSKIYSDRLSLDGKTMAERKDKRVKMLSRLEGLVAKTPGDILLKKTLARSKVNFELEDMKDMQIQETVSAIRGDRTNKF